MSSKINEALLGCVLYLLSEAKTASMMSIDMLVIAQDDVKHRHLPNRD
jgi:hypothetical protein